MTKKVHFNIPGEEFDDVDISDTSPLVDKTLSAAIAAKGRGVATVVKNGLKFMLCSCREKPSESGLTIKDVSPLSARRQQK